MSAAGHAARICAKKEAGVDYFARRATPEKQEDDGHMVESPPRAAEAAMIVT